MTDETTNPPNWWPDGEPTTHPDEREPDRFSVDIHRAEQDLVKDLERIDASNIRIDRSRGRDDFPGCSVSWTRHGTPYVLACDTYRTRTQNMRALGLTVKKLRHVREYGAISTSQAYEGLEAIPADTNNPIQNAQATPMRGPGKRDPPHEVLDIPPDASDKAIKRAAKLLKAKYHPDAEGGNESTFKRVCKAEEALLEMEA